MPNGGGGDEGDSAAGGGDGEGGGGEGEGGGGEGDDTASSQVVQSALS